MRFGTWCQCVQRYCHPTCLFSLWPLPCWSCWICCAVWSLGYVFEHEVIALVWWGAESMSWHRWFCCSINRYAYAAGAVVILLVAIKRCQFWWCVLASVSFDLSKSETQQTFSPRTGFLLFFLQWSFCFSFTSPISIKLPVVLHPLERLDAIARDRGERKLLICWVASCVVRVGLP